MSVLLLAFDPVLGYEASVHDVSLDHTNRHNTAFCSQAIDSSCLEADSCLHVTSGSKLAPSAMAVTAHSDKHSANVSTMVQEGMCNE